MKPIKTPYLIFFLIILSAYGLSENINSCQTINQSGEYTLNSSFSTNETCFTITASNVILNGNGYSIEGDADNYGIEVNEVNNLTVYNFASISNFSRSIYINKVNYSNIFNNSMAINVTTAGYGIYIGTNSQNNNIYSNIVSLNGHVSRGIWLSSTTTHYNNVSNNLIYVEGILSNGIAIGGNNNTVSNNNITTSGFSSHAIYIQNSDSTLNSNHLDTTSTQNAANYFISNNGHTNIFNENLTKINESNIILNEGNVSFYNVNFNKSLIEFNSGELTVYWNVSLNITSEFTSKEVNNTTIQIYDSLNNLIVNTNNNNQSLFTLQEYSQTNSSSNYNTPHTINLSIEGYLTTSSTVNLSETGSTILHLSIEESLSPQIDITNPSNGSSQSKNIEINVSVSDQNNDLNTVNLTLNGTNGTSHKEELQNYTLDKYSTSLNTYLFADGRYTLNVIANDSQGNTNISSINLTIDNTNPSINNVNTSNITTSSVSITLNATDVLAGISNCAYSISNTSNNFSQASQDIYLSNLTNLSSGTSYTANITCMDNAGNSQVYLENFTTVSITITNTPSSSSSSSSGGGGGFLYDCNDKKDNDKDGFIDYPNDPGCESKNDDNEKDNSSVNTTNKKPSTNLEETKTESKDQNNKASIVEKAFKTGTGYDLLTGAAVTDVKENLKRFNFSIAMIILAGIVLAILLFKKIKK